MSIAIRKLRVAITPREWLLRATLSNGALVFGKNRPGYGGRGIYIYRDAIEPELNHLEQFLSPEGIFIDVGANTGVYSIKAAKHVGNKGVVLAIEPFPDVLATLFQSIEINKFANIRLRNFCVGETTSSSMLWMNSKLPNSFGLVKRDINAKGMSTLIVAIDDLFKWEKLDRLDYLKIDAEGAEEKVLSGARVVLEKYRPIIQVEVFLHDVQVNLSNYLAFRAPNSPNKLFIPIESDKIHIPSQLGWTQL
jgi:FkbM family methyltransferase